MSALTRMFRRSRTLVALLLGVLVPYVSTRCLPGCTVVHGAAAHHHAAVTHERGGVHRHAAHDAERPADAGHDHDQPSCCQVTGKLAVTVPSPAAGMAGPLLRPALRVAPTGRLSAGRTLPPPEFLAHGPPVYLLHATLVI
jgi:hypothetical protein